MNKLSSKLYLFNYEKFLCSIYKVIIIKVPFSKCYKKSTTSQNDFKFGLNILEEGGFDMG